MDHLFICLLVHYSDSKLFRNIYQNAYSYSGGDSEVNVKYVL
jgi:hypothetical protein